MKKTLSIILLLTVLLSNPIYSNAETIDVTMNSVNFNVNNQQIQAPNILWQGTTYAPIRVICEALSCQVNWDESNRTVEIDNAALYSMFNTLHSLSLYNSFLGSSSASCTEKISGYYNSVKFNMVNKEEFYISAKKSLDNMLTGISTFLPGNFISAEYYEATIGFCSNLTGISRETYEQSVKNVITAIENYQLAIEAIKNYDNGGQLIYASQFEEYLKRGDSYILDSIKVEHSFINALVEKFNSTFSSGLNK